MFTLLAGNGMAAVRANVLVAATTAHKAALPAAGTAILGVVLMKKAMILCAAAAVFSVLYFWSPFHADAALEDTPDNVAGLELRERIDNNSASPVEPERTAEPARQTLAEPDEVARSILQLATDEIDVL